MTSSIFFPGYQVQATTERRGDQVSSDQQLLCKKIRGREYFNFWAGKDDHPLSEPAENSNEQHTSFF